jgi:phenylacetate-CoA ligase
MYADHTSGTTGTPLTIWLSRSSVRQWYALFEARTRRWHGVDRHDRWGLLGGQPVVGPDQKSPPFWVWNAGLNQLYLSAMHIAPWSVRAYLDAIRKYRIKYLVGYSSSLYFLGLEAEAAGERFPDLKAVITNAEPLFDYQRRAIRDGFGCTVQETYGLCEYVCGAAECTGGRLHLWPEMGIVEILDEEDRPVSPGAPGRIVATGLLNGDMPLVRYDTRDRGELSIDPSVCSCSRSLPSFGKVWGRWDDVVVTKDGRRPVLLDRIFDPPVHVREGQIIQDAIGKFRLRVVPAEGWTPADEELLKAALMNLVGEAEVGIELTPQIERTWAGKFRIIISHVGNNQH